jgi:hypothetical protein
VSAERVDDRVVEREKRSSREETREKNWGSQAVRMPPELPTASTAAYSESCGGRKEASTKRSMDHSLVSWIQMIEGAEVEIASRTTGRFLRQPNPCVFHDSILTSRKALIIEVSNTRELTEITREGKKKEKYNTS